MGFQPRMIMIQLYKIASILAMFALVLFLVIGSYILHRDKDWRRIWKELGKPEVKNIKELKAFIKKQDRSK